MIHSPLSPVTTPIKTPFVLENELSSIKHLFPQGKKDKTKTSQHSIEDKHILEYLQSSFSYFELSSRLRRLSD
jgi:hypothetical protein